MKKIVTGVTLLALVAFTVALATQDTDITNREVRNPKALEAWLEANAADVEARLAAAGALSDRIALVSADDAGTAYISLQSDKGDDAGDLGGWIMSDGSGMYYQTDATTKGTLATKLTLQTDGDITMSGGAVIDNATSSSSLTLTETTIALVGNATVSGTMAVTGVATLTAKPVLNGGADINEEIDIDLDANDEEINIKQAAVTGAGDVGMIQIDDDRTGDTATETDEATITIDAEGVYAIGILDGAVAVESVIDTYAAGTLNLGDSTATKVEIADSAVETEIQGTLDVHEASDFNEQITIDLNAADEEIIISQTAVAHTEGVPLIFIDDNATGATATETDEATLEIDSEGVYALVISDGSFSVEDDAWIGDDCTIVGDLSVSGAALVTGNLILHGEIQTGAGEALTISTAKDAGTGAGNTLALLASDGTTTGAGGAATLTGGAGAGTGNGGAASLTSGAGGAGAQGDGGTVSVVAGAGGVDGNGGSVAITAGASGGGDEDGGNVTITAGAQNGTGVPGRIILAGGGIVMPYVAKTDSYTCTKDDFVVTYNTAAVATNILPDANTVLGQVYIIALQDDDGDLEVYTDNTDTFDGTNTKLVMNDAGDSVTVMATAANVWTILQISDDNKGTLTTQ